MPAAAPHDAEALAKAAADWQTKTRTAAAVAKSRNAGELPGDLERTIEGLNEAAVSWRDVLRRFIDDSARKDYSFSRPNRRHIGRGIILPGLVPDGLNRLVVAVDTSGSFDAECLEQAGAELQAAFDEGGADRITVIYCDKTVQRVDDFEAGELLEFHPKGGGGTSFAPVMDWIEENAADASAVIYITDLHCNDFGEEPAAPVIWAHVGNPRDFSGLAARAPFGEAIQVTA